MFKKLFTAAWVALLFTFCHLAAAATNVSVTATPNNPTAPATITLAVSGDSDGNPIMVTKVEYFNGTTSLGVSVQSPFTLTLNNLASGTYQISVKVTTTDPVNSVLQSAPLAITVGTAPGAATAYFIHTDQLNTPRAITNGSGDLVWQWDSDPFGKEAANEQPAGQPAFTFNQRFPGQQFDRESNLHYNYFRDYDPALGRYIESDPIGLDGGINTFGYVSGDPISYSDALGLNRYRANTGGGPTQASAQVAIITSQIRAINPGFTYQTIRPSSGPGSNYTQADVNALARILRDYQRNSQTNRNGVPVGQFVCDARGNVMIEPVGGRTVPWPGPGGRDTHTLYPNNSTFMRWNPQGHPNNPTPHGHGHLPGTGYGPRGQGTSTDIFGNPVRNNSADAHWPLN